MTTRTVLRYMGCALLGLVACAWIASLIVVILPQNTINHASSANSWQIEQFNTAPTATDTLVVQAAVADLGIQQRYAHIVWSQQQPLGYSRRYAFSFLMLADRQLHQYVIPIGTHPEWRGAVHSVRLVFPQNVHVSTNSVSLQFVQRPVLALDALLGRLLAPYLAVHPPWPYLVLSVFVMLSIGIAILWPTYVWRKRLAIAGLVAGCTTAIVVASIQISVTSILMQAYGTLDEESASMQVAAYNMPAKMNSVLIAANQQLPVGPVLINDSNPVSYIVLRSRYVLYPRPVTWIGFAPMAEIRQQLANGYVGFIDIQARDEAPLAGWQRIGSSTDDLVIWYAPNQECMAPALHMGRWAILRFLIGMSAVVMLGWATAEMIGATGWARLAYAWPLGMSITTWWMVVLSMLGILWSWSNIGLPVLVGAVLLWHYNHRHPILFHTVLPRCSHGEQIGMGILIILIGCVSMQAVVLPFNDYDSWMTWGFRSRSFYLDGSIAPVVRLYQDTRHPPAQSLIQSWGYLAMGGISERLVKLLFPLWYTACIGILWLACRAWHAGPIAIMWALLVATTPIILDHATLGNADLPLAVGLLSAACMLCNWVETGIQRWLIGGTLALIGAAWIKFDGAVLASIVLVAALFARSVALYWSKQRISSTLLVGIAAFATLLALSVPWQLYAWAIKHQTHLSNQLVVVAFLGVLIVAGSMALHSANQRPQRASIISFVVLYSALAGIIVWYLAIRTEEMLASITGNSSDISQILMLTTLGLSIIGEEILLSHSNSTWSLLGSGYGILWLVSGGALLIGWRNLKHDSVLWFLVLAVCGCFGLYLAFYSLLPPDLLGGYAQSIERYLLHIAPLTVLAAARSTRQPDFRHADRQESGFHQGREQ